MLDRFVYGDVSRISPEAPVPVIRVQRDATMLGGAGNAARNIAALGGTVTLLSVVGDDEAGREVERLAGETLLRDPARTDAPRRRASSLMASNSCGPIGRRHYPSVEQGSTGSSGNSSRQ